MNSLHQFMTRHHLPGAVLGAWFGLLALLLLTIFAAYQPLDTFNTVVALAIAATKALLIAVVFMELRHSPSLTITFAGAGFFWLAIMLWLALPDFLSR